MQYQYIFLPKKPLVCPTPPTPIDRAHPHRTPASRPTTTPRIKSKSPFLKHAPDQLIIGACARPDRNSPQQSNPSKRQPRPFGRGGSLIAID